MLILGGVLAAFINNLLAIDHSKQKQLSTAYSMLLYGHDAFKDSMEARAESAFVQSLTACI